MSLEKIINKIGSDAAEEAGRIVDGANEAAEKHREQSGRKLERELDGIKAEAAAQAEDIKKRYTSSDDLACRKMRLAARRDVLEAVYTDAKKALLDDEALYAGFLKKLLIDCAKEADGTVSPSAADARFFGEDVLGEAANAAGRGVALGGNAAIERGFIYRADAVEFDCSLEAVFAQLKKDTETEVNDILFEEQ